MGMMKIWDGYDDQYGPARSARPRVNRRIYPEGTMFSLGCPDTPQMGTWGNRLGDSLGCGPCGLAMLALADSQSIGCCGCGGACIDCPARSLGDSAGVSMASAGLTFGALAAIAAGVLILPHVIGGIVRSSRKRR